VAEVMAGARRLGQNLPEELAELVAEALSEDWEIQRDYRYASGFLPPCPVRVVAWTRDDAVPPEEVRPGWQAYGDVRYAELDGDHREFLACPATLRQLILDDVAG
jgi:surfactin synthase thioesterase subunit